MLVVAQKLVTTTQLYSNELFPSATFIHWCQNLAFTVCPHGKRVSSFVPPASQNYLGWRLIRRQFFICERRDKTVAQFHTSKHIGVRRITWNNKSEHHTCRWNCHAWVQKWRHLVWIVLEFGSFSDCRLFFSFLLADPLHLLIEKTFS